MDNDFWLNLASKDLPRAKDFFSKLGFEMNERHNHAGMVSMFIGSKRVVLNLFPAAAMQEFAGCSVTDTSRSVEVLFSLGASSRAEVDDLAKKAVEAGATLYGKPGEKDGWMYGCGFVDLDGHRWNVLYMDMSKMPGR
jgi:predicted lactoylglutathione lyase